MGIPGSQRITPWVEFRRNRANEDQLLRVQGPQSLRTLHRESVSVIDGRIYLEFARADDAAFFRFSVQ